MAKDRKVPVHHRVAAWCKGHFDNLRERQLIMDVNALTGILGVVIGILLAVEFRLHGSCDLRLKALGLGIFFGAVLGLTGVDIFSLVSNRKEH